MNSLFTNRKILYSHRHRVGVGPVELEGDDGADSDRGTMTDQKVLDSPEPLCNIEPTAEIKMPAQAHHRYTSSPSQVDPPAASF